MNGTIKCNVKNNLRVGWLTEKFPHIQRTKEEWITLNKFVITVPPQSDICPQGKTYPIKAAAINKI
jgi:hypothetical protein